MARVLIVDDQATNRALVASLLRYSGHEALEAADGEAALARVREHRPDLVICDILMPVMDGYEFVRALRADPPLAATQVIFYSATFLNEQAQELAERCGVTEVLVKPCEPREILAAIGRALGRGTQAHAQAHLPVPAVAEAPQEFDRRHLRLVTDKLMMKVEELEAANQRLAALVESAMDAIVGVDATLSVVLFNPAAEAMFGWRADEIVGQSLDRLLPELGNAVEDDLLRAVEADRQQRRAKVISGRRRSGALFPIEASIAKTGEDGMRYSAILRDVTERVEADERIRRLARVATVLSDINSLIVRVRRRDELFHEACRIAVNVGHFKRAWIGVVATPPQAGVQLAAFCGADDGYAERLREVLQDGSIAQGFFGAALRERRPMAINDLQQAPDAMPLRQQALDSGTRAIAWLPLATARTPVGVLVLHADTPGFFDEQEMQLLKELAGDMSFALKHLDQQERLLRLAFYDPLTGLANESLLRERLGEHLPSAAERGRQQGLVLIDLVHFKRINDSVGRHAGDALLRQVADRLVQRLGDRNRFARIVADRFAAVLPDVAAEKDLLLLLADYQECFAAPFEIDGEAVRVSARFGVAVFPRDGSDAEALIRHAEAALKSSKSGNQAIVFYDPRMSAAVAAALALENQLRQAVDRNEFVLHYQPKVDVDSRRVTGLEALLRWYSPDRGLVQPADFIGLLEETNLIVPVGLWAVRRAAQDHRRWRERFGDVPSIAVNVSAVQLRRERFVDEVLAVLAAEGAVPGAIDLEVTESLLMEDVHDAIGKLEALHAKEVSIAIDDFGTGYSSLAYLSKLPAHVLKIDRSFIAAMMTDADSMTLVSTMISLAHSLRMRVVAEGVETEEQAKILRLLRCDQMQGFLVSRPVPQEEIASRLQALQ